MGEAGPERQDFSVRQLRGIPPELCTKHRRRRFRAVPRCKRASVFAVMFEFVAKASAGDLRLAVDR